VFLPFQGGGQEGDGVSVGDPLYSAVLYMGKDHFIKGGGFQAQALHEKSPLPPFSKGGILHHLGSLSFLSP